jgi:hypothetical protein
MVNSPFVIDNNKQQKMYNICHFYGERRRWCKKIGDIEWQNDTILWNTNYLGIFPSSLYQIVECTLLFLYSTILPNSLFLFSYLNFAKLQNPHCPNSLFMFANSTLPNCEVNVAT